MYWIFGVLLTTTLFASLAILSNFRFENSDDIMMVKAFMGFEGGQSASFSLYLHTLLTWALYGLSLCTPKVAWFSIFQVGLLFFSCTVLAKGFFQLASKMRHTVIAGTLTSVLFLATFAAFVCCRINFTTTASLAGAAAIVQTMTVDFESPEKRTRVFALLLALLLLAASYCLRAYAALPSFVFINVIFLWRIIPQANDTKHFSVTCRATLKTMLIFVSVLATLFAIQQAEISLRGLQGYIGWNDANGALLDYSDFETNAAPAIASDSGLTAAEIKLVQQWYFMSSNIDEQALRKMADAYSQTERNGLATLWNFFVENERYQYLTSVVGLLYGLCLIQLRKGAWRTPLLSLASIVASFLLLYYLAMRGRLLSRAVDSVLIPCAALNLGFVFYSWKGNALRGLRRIAAILLSGLVAAAAFGSLRITGEAITCAQDFLSMQREAELETYALQNPDLLIVRTPNLLRDTRLFPDVRNGTPGNIMIWGDWLCRTPSWNHQLALFGFDANYFSAADWLKDCIVFASLSPEDTAELCDYLTEAIGEPVIAEESDVYGTLHFYRFITL